MIRSKLRFFCDNSFAGSFIGGSTDVSKGKSCFPAESVLIGLFILSVFRGQIFLGQAFIKCIALIFLSNYYVSAFSFDEKKSSI